MQSNLEKTKVHSSFGISLSYLIAGILFGIILFKSEVISWYRIQEMFRFQSFHMYGVFILAIVVAMSFIWLIKKAKLHSVSGEIINVPAKAPTYFRYILGGSFFGLGWAMTGACPGPLFALLGGGFYVFLVVILSAILGTWVYGTIRKYLPH